MGALTVACLRDMICQLHKDILLVSAESDICLLIQDVRREECLSIYGFAALFVLLVDPGK